MGNEKILGMRYNFASDEFFFQIDPDKFMKNVVNKRGMLQVIASVFDPLNAWSPWTIEARLIFQRAVQAVKGWNDADLLPQPILDEFKAWQESGIELERLRIARWTTTREAQDGENELHVFSDASAGAYGVVAYRRTVSSGGAIHVAFVGSKAHVVPVKVAAAGHHESIPRLELQAARLAAELRASVVREADRPFDRVFHHTDSKCVLRQLRDNETRFKIYFANRISTIQALTVVKPDGDDEWRFVPSASNPADFCSRGLKASDPKWRQWLEGPEFLWKDVDEWPQLELKRTSWRQSGRYDILQFETVTGGG